MDKRIKKLAKNLVEYSTKIKKDEKVLINCSDESTYDLVKEIIKEVYKKGAYPYVEINESKISREIAKGATEERYDFLLESKLEFMENMDAYIGIRGSKNITEFSDVDQDKLKMIRKKMKPILDERVGNTKWVVLRYPNESMAQLAETSTEAFEEFYFNVCNLNYGKMSKAMDSLVELMNKTDKVKIVGEGTDLTFSIKDIPAIKCAGEFNIPDGEVFTAPVRKSVNGVITYNTPSIYRGKLFNNVKLKFKDGKIIDATANDTDAINDIFDTDEGARYVGEFAIGVNPYIEKAMKDILFDEKIKGSFHFTPGKCYDEAPNGNESAIHWDLVCIQTKEYGGGKIYFDDVLIREDGRFVIDELKSLNPENLK